MKIGDSVRLVGLPAISPEPDPPLGTLALFQKCLGQVFIVSGFNEIGWAELEVESVSGSVGETIWVEPEYLIVVSS
jgi:hypothetical protein